MKGACGACLADGVNNCGALDENGEGEIHFLQGLQTLEACGNVFITSNEALPNCQINRVEPHFCAQL